MGRSRRVSPMNLFLTYQKQKEKELKDLDTTTSDGKANEQIIKQELKRFKENKHEHNQARWRMFQNNGKRNVGRKAGRKTRY